ncbi:MAG: glucose 1-dehydrogenase [Rhodospirillaceae bacterium]|nr:glucose 1-dehydrogenase [Rhodospirillaceae bacterium]
MKRIQDKICIVTGAARGIGKGCAERFAAEGGIVFVCDRDGDEAADAAATIGGRAQARQMDVSIEDDWIRLIEAVLATHGRLDVLVNNAGIQISKTLAETTLEDWRRVMAVNADGAFLGCKHGVAAMKRHGEGSIINMSSTYAMVADELNIAYCASKAAVRHLTKAVALACAREGTRIRVNSIHPGIVPTPLLEHEMSEIVRKTPGLTRESLRADWLKLFPLGFGEPADIAAGALFLASDESKYMTGSELVIDGGHLTH